MRLTRGASQPTNVSTAVGNGSKSIADSKITKLPSTSLRRFVLGAIVTLPLLLWWILLRLKGRR